MPEQTSEPETVAWEFTAVTKTENKEFEHPAVKLSTIPPEPPESGSDEIRDVKELIRRADAEEYYRKKERQQIREILGEVFEEWKELQNGAPTQRLKERYAFGIKALRDLKEKLKGKTMGEEDFELTNEKAKRVLRNLGEMLYKWTEGYEAGVDEERQQTRELLEEKEDFWEGYIEELLSKVEYKPREDGEIEPGKIKNAEVRNGIVNTLVILDEIRDLKEKLKGGD